MMSKPSLPGSVLLPPVLTLKVASGIWIETSTETTLVKPWSRSRPAKFTAALPA